MQEWINKRCPQIDSFIQHMKSFPVKNRNFWPAWTLGGVIITFISFLIPSGIILALTYTATQGDAFLSVAEIMRRVPAGWFIRSLHQAGVSFLFAALYLHMARGLICFSYKEPRELVWTSGWLLLALFLLTAFAGYVLPWGQMSYWASTVVINALNDLSPSYFNFAEYFFGTSSLLAPGNPSPTSVFLHRAFTLHFIIGLGSIAFIAWHILHVHSLSERRSGKHDKNEALSKTARRLPFYPYFAINDLAIISLTLIAFTAVVFFYPLPIGDADNLIPANPNVTPPHIHPQWYLTPFFSVLRSVPSAIGGILVCCIILISSAILPWLDQSKEVQFNRPQIFRILPLFYCLSFAGLGYFGMQSTTGYEIWIARLCIVWLITYPLILLPLWSYNERHGFFTKGVKQ